MLRRGVWVAFAVGVSSALAGCGTILNLAENDHTMTLEPTRRVYGGVRLDAAAGPGYLAGAVEPKGKPDLEAPGLRGFLFRAVGDRPVNFALGTAALADIPLSAVGDTLTLPLILYWRATGQAPPAAAASPTIGGCLQADS